MSERTTRSTTDPLEIAALDIERHVAAAGWDQSSRLFALVDAADLAQREPGMPEPKLPGELTAIEQDELPEHSDIEELLAQIAWPESVAGVAVAIERIVLPPQTQAALPQDAAKAAATAADHPDRADVRILAAVHRDGREITLLRQRAHDQDEDVATGTNIAPGLIEALRATLAD